MLNLSAALGGCDESVREGVSHWNSASSAVEFEARRDMFLLILMVLAQSGLTRTDSKCAEQELF